MPQNKKFLGKEIWPLHLGASAAIVTAFSSPYYTQGAFYATQFLSYSYYIFCLTILMIAYNRYLNRDAYSYNSAILVGIIVSSVIVIHVELSLTHLLKFNPVAERVLMLSRHMELLQKDLWWRSAQFVLFQIGWMGAIIGIQRIKHVYRDYLWSLGISKSLQEALFRIRSGYIGEQFLSQALHKVAELADSNSTEAESIVENLGELVRYALETSQKHRVSALLESQSIQQYLQVYTKVIGDDFNCRLDVPDKLQRYDVLPLSLFGLIAYLLGKIPTYFSRRYAWDIVISLSFTNNHLLANITCNPKADAARSEIERIATSVNSEILDSMRQRLEQAYAGGSYIEFMQQENIQFRVALPL